jgi:hypothetical protein
MDNLWNFMFFTGYFKKVNERMDSEDNRYLELSIPNREVKYIFRTKILKWFEEKIKAKDLSVLYNLILNKDSETFQKELNKLLRDTISFNDAYENFYHGFVVGVLANMHDHIVKSNRESGNGRSDVYIKSPSIFDPAVIMELKICKEPKEIYKMCDKALEQIETNKYDEELRQEGYENIIKYGISFYRKDCIIKLG